MKSWNELPWWTSEECVKLHEKLGWGKVNTWQPEQKNVYRSLHETPFPSVKCVIVGQDPYPTPGYATGLAFSVPCTLSRTSYPPSLTNIFTELGNDLHYPYPSTGDLTTWAKRGVLLWNNVLTVEPRQPGSHKKWGWEELTAQVLGAVDQHHRSVVFVLWGRNAQQFVPVNNPVIRAPHPSPLSAHRGFLGSRPFSSVNALLTGNPIDWRLP